MLHADDRQISKNRPYSCSHRDYNLVGQIFSVKGQRVSISGFAGHKVTAANSTLSL